MSETDCTSGKIKSDEYIIGEKLGSGTFGRTYMAKKTGDSRTFVVKILNIRNPRAPTKSSVDLATIHTEINVLKKIADSGCTKDILCYYDHFIDCSNPNSIQMVIVTLAFENAVTLENFIRNRTSDLFNPIQNKIDELKDEKQEIKDNIDDVEDDVERSSLEERLKVIEKEIDVLNEEFKENLITTPLFSPRVLLKIIFNILKALEHLEKLCIGHADIKPHNILINPNTYDIQIIDFGVSCTDNFDFSKRGKCSESEPTCHISGTLLYNSPELLESRLQKINRISPKDMQLSDVFSLGIVFYRLANATFPFHEKFLNELNEHILMYLVVYDLLPYYKKTKIDSHYNQNKTPLDQKINKLIESMLTVSPEQRPSFSNLLQQTQNLINELQQTQNINDF